MFLRITSRVTRVELRTFEALARLQTVSWSRRPPHGESGIARRLTRQSARSEELQILASWMGIYRPMNDPKRVSSHMLRRTELLESELRAGGLKAEPGKAKLVETRGVVEHGWEAVSDVLIRQGQFILAADVRRFVEQMPPPRTDKEWLAVQRHACSQTPCEGSARITMSWKEFYG